MDKYIGFDVDGKVEMVFRSLRTGRRVLRCHHLRGEVDLFRQIRNFHRTQPPLKGFGKTNVTKGEDAGYEGSKDYV